MQPICSLSQPLNLIVTTKQVDPTDFSLFLSLAPSLSHSHSPSRLRPNFPFALRVSPHTPIQSDTSLLACLLHTYRHTLPTYLSLLYMIPVTSVHKPNNHPFPYLLASRHVRVFQEGGQLYLLQEANVLAIECLTSRPIPSVLPRCLAATVPESSLLPSDCVVTTLVAVLHNTGQSLPLLLLPPGYLLFSSSCYGPFRVIHGAGLVQHCSIFSTSIHLYSWSSYSGVTFHRLRRHAAKMYPREHKNNRKSVIRMDPDCAICHAPANLACDCEAKGLEVAVRHAEQRMMQSMYNEIR